MPSQNQYFASALIMVVNQAAYAQQLFDDNRLPASFFGSAHHEELEQPLFNYHHHHHHHTHPLDHLSHYSHGFTHEKDLYSHRSPQFDEMRFTDFPSAHGPGLGFLSGSAFDHAMHKKQHDHSFSDREHDLTYAPHSSHHALFDEEDKQLYHDLKHYEHDLRKELEHEYGHSPSYAHL